jgi:hypothetical protein
MSVHLENELKERFKKLFSIIQQANEDGTLNGYLKAGDKLVRQGFKTLIILDLAASSKQEELEESNEPVSEKMIYKYFPRSVSFLEKMIAIKKEGGDRNGRKIEA